MVSGSFLFVGFLYQESYLCFWVESFYLSTWTLKGAGLDLL